MRAIQTHIFGTSFISSQSEPITLVTKSAEGGSLYFSNSNAYVNFPGSESWAVGTGDYTIEWWQWQTATATNPRVFSVGSWPTASIAVSIENGVFYLWGDGSISFSIEISNYINQWVHFAISRHNNNLMIFQNGTWLGGGTNNANITDSVTSLTIGNEGNTSSVGSFLGYITNFRWTKGEALYTASFTPPQQPLTVGANTKLLLLAATNGNVIVDSTGLNVSSGSSVEWQGVGPYAQRAWLDAGNPASYTDPSNSWLDLTPYGNNVTLTSATYNPSVGGYLSFGINGGALFDSNPATVNENSVPSATLSMWINTSDNSNYNYIAGLRGSADFEFFFLLLEDINTTEARVVTTNGTFDINVNFNSYYNTWCHICFTVNGNRSDLYINGALVGSNTNIIGTWGTAPTEFTIARENGGGNQTPNLNMAMLRYWTRNRTGDEILAEFEAERSRFSI